MWGNFTAWLSYVFAKERGYWPAFWWVVTVACFMCVAAWIYGFLLIKPAVNADAISVRTSVVAVIITLFGLLGLAANALYTFKRAIAVEKQVDVAREELKVSREGQVTERFSRAIEQLGHLSPSSMFIRVGSIYALQQIALDHPREYHIAVMEILTAFLRHYSADPHGDDKILSQGRLPHDFATIAAVLRRRDANIDFESSYRLDLTGAFLRGANLEGANLSGAILQETDLTGAGLRQANLSGANLEAANLCGANLIEADLSGAVLTGTNLSGASLEEADLSGTDLMGANLSGADLTGANLSGASLVGANLSTAHLAGANLFRVFALSANLSGAYLWEADLSGADLEDADLSRANLEHTNLSEVKPRMTREQLEAAITDETTIWPKHLTDQAEETSADQSDSRPSAEPATEESTPEGD